MNRPACETCPFWKGPPNLNYDSMGTCRRYPPKPSGRMPSTDKSDWCGEHPDFKQWLIRASIQSLCGHSFSDNSGVCILCGMRKDEAIKTPPPR